MLREKTMEIARQLGATAVYELPGGVPKTADEALQARRDVLAERIKPTFLGPEKDPQVSDPEP